MKALVVLHHFIVLAVTLRQNMALLVEVSDDQKGLGSVLAISSDMLENEVATAAPCRW
jgi:hypothetical protein